jgi:hypothetical protein
MKLTGKEGILRIFDGSKILHGVAPLNGYTTDVVQFDGVSTWTNITSNISADDTSYGNNFLADNNDVIYIGSTNKFALVQFLKSGASDYAVGAGALIAKYYNGTNFNTLLSGVSDGTAVTGNCFAKDGNISFQIPRDWALGANAFNAALDADKYYIALMTTTSSSTDADADILAPLGAQMFEIKFAKMDFSGPVGRPLQAEQLVLNRSRMDSAGHYVKGADDVLYTPLEVGFSCLIDDTYNNAQIMEALACGNPNYGQWTGTGATTKGQTKNDGTNFNPAFADSTKKAVNIQMLWTGGYGIGMAYYEAYFPPEEITLTEAEDGITLSAKGGVYGAVEAITGFGIRY